MSIGSIPLRFKVEIDTSPPIVVRVYKDEETDTLKLITDELAIMQETFPIEKKLNK